MGKLDILTKEYMKRPSIFADVFNQYIYKGCQVILPDRLVELDTTEIVIPYGGGQASVPVQKYRDVSKMLTAMTDGRAAYCILAVENEGKINYAMPVKNGLYDFINLAGQVTKSAVIHKASSDKSVKPTGDEFLSGFWKSDRLLPVMTVVVYFGSEMWDGPMCLSEMYTDCDAELLKYVADYRINLITPMNLTDHEIDGFQTGMREIMRYIKYSNDRKAIDSILKTDRRFKSVERRAVEIINAATNSKNKIIAYYDARASKGNMPAGRWTPGARTLSRRHLKSCKRSVQIVIKRFHDLEKFCCFCDKCFCIAQVLVLDRIFQIPALIFQIFCLRVFFLIACRDIF